MGSSQQTTTITTTRQSLLLLSLVEFWLYIISYYYYYYLFIILLFYYFITLLVYCYCYYCHSFRSLKWRFIVIVSVIDFRFLMQILFSSRQQSISLNLFWFCSELPRLQLVRSNELIEYLHSINIAIGDQWLFQHQAPSWPTINNWLLHNS